jgi:hypothetical protein
VLFIVILVSVQKKFYIPVPIQKVREKRNRRLLQNKSLRSDKPVSVLLAIPRKIAFRLFKLEWVYTGSLKNTHSSLSMANVTDIVTIPELKD